MSYSTTTRALPPHYMRRNEVIVHNVDGRNLYAYADMLGFAKHWPETIEHGCKTYKYVCNEVMTPEAVGNYSGHSKYELLEVPPPEGGVTMTETFAAWLHAMEVKPEVIHALRLCMANALHKYFTAYTYADAMELSSEEFGLAGVKHQVNYLMTCMGIWHGAQACECKDVLKAWAKPHIK